MNNFIFQVFGMIVHGMERRLEYLTNTNSHIHHNDQDFHNYIPPQTILFKKLFYQCLEDFSYANRSKYNNDSFSFNVEL